MSLKQLAIGTVIGASVGTGSMIGITADKYDDKAVVVEMKGINTEDITILPKQFRFSMLDGKPMVLVPGSKYQIIVEENGVIIGKAIYSPDIESYPKDSSSVLVGRLKFDIIPDVTSDKELLAKVGK